MLFQGFVVAAFAHLPFVPQCPDGQILITLGSLLRDPALGTATSDAGLPKPQ